MAIVYQIRNTQTGDSYIGSTIRFPFMRWAEHFFRLRHGNHPSEKMQAAWRASRFEDWVFQVLESGIEPNLRFKREMFWYESLHPTLNVPSRITRMIDRDKTEKRVAEMLAAGCTYRAIVKEVGCSLGWLTLFKHRSPS